MLHAMTGHSIVFMEQMETCLSSSHTSPQQHEPGKDISPLNHKEINRDQPKSKHKHDKGACFDQTHLE